MPAGKWGGAKRGFRRNCWPMASCCSFGINLSYNGTVVNNSFDATNIFATGKEYLGFLGVFGE